MRPGWFWALRVLGCHQSSESRGMVIASPLALAWKTHCNESLHLLQLLLVRRCLLPTRHGKNWRTLSSHRARVQTSRTDLCKKVNSPHHLLFRSRALSTKTSSFARIQRGKARSSLRYPPTPQRKIAAMQSCRTRSLDWQMGAQLRWSNWAEQLSPKTC